jgi:serine/threonine protein phosphatase 1
MSVTYAIGDTHGLSRMLQTLIARCRQHAGDRPAMFVLLGDYIDRGPDSAGVIRAIMNFQAELPGRVVALKGNHEATMLEVVDGTATADHWLTQGGTETLRSYGIDSARELPDAHVRWLRSLPLSHDDGRRLFVHAGIDPERSIDKQREHDLIWIREPFLSDTRDHGRLIVHGHTPLDDGVPDLRSNRLNLDTGAVFGGPLTAAIFTDSETTPVGFLQAE